MECRAFVFIVGLWGVLTLIACSSPSPAGETEWPASFGYGRSATPAEISAKDIDVRPDGKGLPAGEGTVAAGKVIYAAKCAACHGKTGVEGPFDKLVAPPITKDAEGGRERKAIGNYWPYASTLYDYINRAMPFNQPGSLSADEVYSVTAYLLFANRIIGADAVLNRKSLPLVVMPAHERFVTDDRRGGREIK
ncbi:c-type cytochrome [Arcticibacter tournemirensis]|uniref:C-type cytochrome n=1 Tax=Arcticibacter tournemirensis TaxID=699437 RepID=A0A4Q0M6G1_9SPHI|nr:cytochrome c [Arcticibacter tournemirensis]RXF68641.1 c-type cytochrome [Arcticibacter tournemirensis]